MENKFWTNEEEQLLKDKYGKWYLKTIAEELNRSEQSVRMKAYKLGLVKSSHRFDFTNDEIDFIVENYPVRSTREVAEKVHCSEAKVYSFARSMKLVKKTREVIWSEEDIEYLKKHLDSPYAELEKVLEKSTERIKSKIKDLGLKKRRPSSWTTVQDAFLEENLNKLPVEELVAQLGKSKSVIKKRCRELKLKDAYFLDHEWNEEQERLLIDSHGVMTISEVCKKIGRTYDSIRSKKVKLGLSTKYEDLPEHESLVVRLVEKGCYVEEIAKETGFTIKALLRYGFENNISIKSSPKNLSAEIRAIRYGFEDPISFKTKAEKKALTLADWWKYWALTFRFESIAERTKQKYYFMYCNLFESRLGKMKLKDIQRSDLQEYFNVYGVNRSKQTVQTSLQFLKSCFQDAMGDGLVEYNPAANIKLVYKEQKLSPMELKKKREEKKWLEIDEYQRFKRHLILQIQKSLYNPPGTGGAISVQSAMMIILVALKTGMRFGEILGLTRDDILKETSELNVDKTWGYRKSKDMNQFLLTKNSASIRKVAVDPELMIMLELFTRWQDEHKQDTVENTLFVGRGENTNVYNPNINNRLANMLKEIDIKPISVHKLRHTQASYLMAKKVPIEVVAKRLGHADTNMIRKTYGHLLKETEEKGTSMILGLI
ncbi:hypothetical protein K5E_25370 [Enterococcus thailandicus]|uniref:site-specific integrase n=1 Tax=Enterococcus thailandicus TaxID=417368 RepID=UPI00244D8DF5|nr:site-specific integrase [Enterococcus thailandicus]GMC10398.1 hypothetical protein K5E_25370 [Enterococcus thailandicus]